MMSLSIASYHMMYNNTESTNEDSMRKISFGPSLTIKCKLILMGMFCSFASFSFWLLCLFNQVQALNFVVVTPNYHCPKCMTSDDPDRSTYYFYSLDKVAGGRLA